MTKFMILVLKKNMFDFYVNYFEKKKTINIKKKSNTLFAKDDESLN
jgi:hypothetical protein